MKIGIYISKLQMPTKGGGYTFMFSFLQELLNVKTKHRFYIYYMADNKIEFEDNNFVKFIKLESQETHKKVLLWKIRKKSGLLKHYLLQHNIDVVFTLYPEYIDYDCPLFVTIWDYGHKDIPYFPEVYAKGAFESRETLYRYVSSRASRIIVSNNDAKLKTCSYYNVLEDKVITNSLPTPDYVYKLDADNSILTDLKLQKGEYIFYPAQFWAHKNHIRIIKALKILKEKDINIKAVFSGSDKGNLNYLKQKIRENKLEDSVLFAGFITKEQVIALYKNALALVYASLLGPDNLPPLEAMALECPVLVSDIPGHRIQLKDSCIFFNPMDENDLADKLLKIKNNSYDKNLSTKGYTLASEYSTENYLKNTLKMFDNFEPILECWRHV